MAKRPGSLAARRGHSIAYSFYSDPSLRGPPECVSATTLKFGIREILDLVTVIPAAIVVPQQGSLCCHKMSGPIKL